MKIMHRIQPHSLSSRIIAIFCTGSLIFDPILVLGQESSATPPSNMSAAATTSDSQLLPSDQLDSLVAPIALYPDPLLAQTLAASTYPLEIIQLQQWLDRNKDLKGQALETAVLKQNWDPTIQAMAGFPDVVVRLSGNITWTTDLGNAYLAQPTDVMNAVQRMRAKAQGTGALKTSAEQVVETQTVDNGQQVIVIEQAKPDVVYVPTYDPVVVYGQPAYPYPPVDYPGYVAGVGLAFGAGLLLGAAWGGGWGWNCGWGHGDINVNVNNNYNRNFNNINGGNFNGKWGHHVEHRGAAPYGDRRTADRFGGGARQRPGGPGGIGGPGKPGGIGGAGGIGGPGKPGGIGGAGGIGGPGKPGGIGGAGGIGGPGKPGGIGGAGGIGGPGKPGGIGDNGGIGNVGKPGGIGGVGGGTTRPSTRPSGGDRVGNRSVSPSRGNGAGNSAFGGRNQGGGAARATSSRGGRSMGGGGFSGGGGARGGGGRGGGGHGRR